MDVLTIIGKISLTAAKPLIESLGQSKAIIQLKREIGLESKPDKSFNSIYNHTLVEYGTGKSEDVLVIFNDEYVIKFFEKYYPKPEECIKAVSDIAPIVDYEINTEEELREFSEKFVEIANIALQSTDVPAAIQQQKIQDIHDDILSLREQPKPIYNEPNLTFESLIPQKPPHKIVGRRKLLDSLKEKLFAEESNGLYALNGKPGVGKTALTIELAWDEEIREHFSDGVLWSSLGKSPDIFRIMGDWLSCLGLKQDHIGQYQTVKDRKEALHRYLGDGKYLLIVDDAWDSETAQLFKVGDENCAQVLTTRQPHIAIDFAGRSKEKIDELIEQEGLNLLKQFAVEIVNTDPDIALELVRKTGGLPLVLILIGKFLQHEADSAVENRVKRALDKLKGFIRLKSTFVSNSNGI